MISDGTTKSTNIQIGGHRFAQEGFTNNVVQLIDNVYLNTDKINYTFGTDVMYTHANSVYGSEVNGRFHFNNAGGSTLQNFNNMTPYRYYREVPLMADPSVEAGIWNMGLYGQMQTKLAKGLDATLGLRGDYSVYPRSPLNQLVNTELGIRTDNKLNSFQLQPRLQLNWDIKEKHTDYIRMGAGIFASDINNYMTINNLTFDGTHLATVDVRSPNLPAVDFIGYRNGTTPIPAVTAFQTFTINTNASDAQVPVVYKANLSYNKIISDKLRIGLTGYATLGRHNYMYVDRNMVDKPFFTLAEEGNRGVFVPSIPANGAGDWQTGRKTTKLGRVLELNSQGKVNQFAAVLDATWQYFKDAEISFSYTRNQSKDNTSYNGNVANTATLNLPVRDDPRDLSKMSYSDNHFSNKLVFYGTLPTVWGIKVGVRYSGIGGTRYSFLSGANNNGDFVTTNDLAFVFDKDNPATQTAVRTGLQSLLDNPDASQSIKDYLLASKGQIAERNGGVNGFYGVCDVRVSKRFKLYGNKTLDISGDIFNLANLLNKENGRSFILGNQTLYALGVPASGSTPALPNYDTTNKRFNYRVNNSGIVNPGGNPWQIQLGARVGF